LEQKLSIIYRYPLSQVFVKNTLLLTIYSSYVHFGKLRRSLPRRSKSWKIYEPPRNFAPRNPLRHSDRVPFPLGGTIFTLAPASSFYLFR